MTYLWHDGLVASMPYETSNGAVFIPATINSINDSGYVAGATLNGLLRSAGTWNGTTFATAGTLPGYMESFANGVNGNGVLVGSSYTNGGNARMEPTEWTSTQIVDLGLSAGSTRGFADSVNSNGQIVGIQFAPEGQIATLWDSGKVIALTPPSGSSEAIGINDRGVIVGSINSQSFVWQAGVLSILPCAGASGVHEINDAGEAVGSCGGQAVVWNTSTGTMIDLGSGLAQSINSEGVVVGRTGSAADNPLFEQTFTWSAAQGLQILPGFVWSEPFGINDSGEIVGYGEIAPEPGTILLCVAGLFALASSRIRLRLGAPHRLAERASDTGEKRHRADLAGFC